MGSGLLEETREIPLDRLVNVAQIPVGGETLEIHPLALGQLLALGRLVAKVAQRVPFEQINNWFFFVSTMLAYRRGALPVAPSAPAPEAKPVKRQKGRASVPAGTAPSVPSSNGTAEKKNDLGLDWTPLLLALEDDIWGEACAIVTGRPAEWCLSHLSMTAIGLLIEAVLQQNDTEVLRRLFTRAASPPSPSSDTSGRDD